MLEDAREAVDALDAKMGPLIGRIRTFDSELAKVLVLLRDLARRVEPEARRAGEAGGSFNVGGAAGGGTALRWSAPLA